MFNNTSIHGVKRITATTFDDLESTPVIIRITGKPGDDMAEITLHTQDAAFSLALVAAINKVDEDRRAKVVEPDPDDGPLPPPPDYEDEVVF